MTQLKASRKTASQTAAEALARAEEALRDAEAKAEAKEHRVLSALARAEEALREAQRKLEAVRAANAEALETKRQAVDAARVKVSRASWVAATSVARVTVPAGHLVVNGNATQLDRRQVNAIKDRILARRKGTLTTGQAEGILDAIGCEAGDGEFSVRIKGCKQVIRFRPTGAGAKATLAFERVTV